MAQAQTPSEPATKIDDGGPAFPVLDDTGSDHLACRHPGMTLRDYFAAKANPVEIYGSSTDEPRIPVPIAVAIMGTSLPAFTKDALANALWWAEALARWKYLAADSMLAARKGGVA